MSFFKRKSLTLKSEQKEKKLHEKMTVETHSKPLYNQETVIPIEQRLKGNSPTCNGLFPHEVLILSYAPKFLVGNNQFQGFWWHRYGIRNVSGILNSLSEKGLIKKGSLADAMYILKQTDIKRLCKSHGLKSSGNKKELVDQLIESVPESELELGIQSYPYVLTKSGQELLKEYEWIPYIHNHSIEDLNIWSLTEMMQAHPGFKYRDIIWGYLNQRGMDHFIKKNYGLYRNCRFTMSEFVAEEKKMKEAFSLLCEVIAYDLSGLSNGFDPTYLPQRMDFFFPYEKSIVKLAPGITERVFKYSNDFKWEVDNLRVNLYTEISTIFLAFQLFTNEECVDIVVAEIYKDLTVLERIYLEAQERVEREYGI